MAEPKEGDLRIWWIPQVPGQPFEVPVKDVEQAIFLLDVLGKYDLFQFEHKIKGDYCNAGGLGVFENGEWSEYENEDGQTVDDLRREVY